jgi:hypothetical protein
MAADLPTLVGLWQPQQFEILIPAVGKVNLLLPDPARLAWGIAMNNVTGVIQIAFQNTIGNVPGIYIQQLEEKWFYWSKHASLVALGWDAIQASGGPNKVTIYTVTQTQRK